MATSRTTPIRELSVHMDKNCINHGDRGELIATLLVMQARDALAKSTGQRWVYVHKFIEKLLGASPSTATSMPYNVCSGPSGEGRQSLADRFKNSRMWFNHVLKIQKADLINVRHLWKFITRGAMVLCANDQAGVDIVLPVCYSDSPLSPENVTAVLIQVKNSTSFGKDIHAYLFDTMDPFKIKLFDTDMEKPLPVIIRMVFVLGSNEGAVKYVTPPCTTWQSNRCNTYTSYGIWCAGISRETFPVIGDDGPAYRKVLDHTRLPHQESLRK